MSESKELSRRKFLAAVASTAATSCLPLAGSAATTSDPQVAGAALAAGEGQIGVSREAPTAPPIIVLNAGYRLLIDSEKGSIASFQSTFGSDRELLIPNHVRLPLFKIELMNDHSEFKTIASSQAKEITVHQTGDEGDQTVTIEFEDLADLPVDARATIRCPATEPLTYWNLELTNASDGKSGIHSSDECAALS